jgi:curved DNA-binding protein CbpA
MDASDLRQAYAVLRLSPPVDEEHLKRHYKTLVKRWHPDRYQAIRSARRKPLKGSAISTSPMNS